MKRGICPVCGSLCKNTTRHYVVTKTSLLAMLPKKKKGMKFTTMLYRAGASDTIDDMRKKIDEAFK